MTWPASDVNKSNADQATDSPATFRSDVLDLLTKFNQLRNHVSSLCQTILSRSTADLIRSDLGAAASGANTDITSIQGVSVGMGGGNVSTNTRYGSGALLLNATGGHNTAVGLNALLSNTTDYSQPLYPSGYPGFANSAFGSGALYNNRTGQYNCAFGVEAIYSIQYGDGNVALGYYALRSAITGSYNTAIGYQALFTGGYSNTTGLGANASVTGSNQVQLGSSSTSTYVYGTVQNRSDLRDKADVRDTVLGLDFIKALRPVDYRWDMREDYRPERPKEPPEDATEEEVAAHQAAMAAWLEEVKPENITRDGSKKRTRYHHGLIAQEVKAVIDATGVDFGGYQDHKITGGNDVLSIGYDELIAPLIKSVQQLAAQNAELVARLDAAGL